VTDELLAASPADASRPGAVPLPLKPTSGLVPLDGSGTQWRAVDATPRFELRQLLPFAGQWVEFTVSMSAAEQPSGNPAIDLDAGAGAAETGVIVLPHVRHDTGLSTIIFAVPPNLQCAWFLPCSAPVAFALTSVRLEPLSKWQAIRRMSRALRGTGRFRSLRESSAKDWRSLLAPSVQRRIKGEFVEAYKAAVRARASTYLEWIALFEVAPGSYPLLRQKHAQWDRLPLISIVMPTYNTPVRFLREAIESVIAQVYPHWELCIADDASTTPQVRRTLNELAAQDRRIRVGFRDTNGHISAASNSALALASGEFTALLDHDDRLHPLALHYLAEAIVKDPAIEMLYTDEDKLDAGGVRCVPHFKCDFNYDLLLAQNMVSHLGCYKTATLRQMGGFRIGFEGAQDWDVALRFHESVGTAKIRHIPRVLYHWRESRGSTAISSDQKPYAAQAGRRVVADHLQRTVPGASVEPAPDRPDWNRIRYALPDRLPMVSIVIPTRDRVDLLKTCLDSIFSRTSYANYEVLVVDNGSVEPESTVYLESLQNSRVTLLHDDAPFNYSRLNNRTVESAHGDLICLMNNDIEVINHDWLDEMVSIALRPSVGVVGARLWYPDFRLQHAGVILGIGGIAGHAHRLLPRGDPGYFGRAVLQQQLSAVTGACMLVTRPVWDALGGLDESLEVAFNDIDFCLRASASGYKVIWTPFAELIHHESVTRGSDDTPDKIARFRSETAFMQKRWGETMQRDPFYSPDLTLSAEDFSLSWNPRLF
jgi:GT2 family glycosyltransferase